MLTQERLRHLVDYDVDTGVFTWAISRVGAKKGSICGRINVHGYREIGINYTLHRANRLAWLYMTGSFPDMEIDHINRIKHDDSWNNLRLCTHNQNAANVSLKKSNTSGCKGVVWDKDRNLWRVQIRIQGKKKNLGRFANYDDAVKVSLDALNKEFGEFNYNGN
jgi:hypothetical protein